MNLDQLLDGTIDQLADKPEFKPFPAGIHVVQVFFKHKKFDGGKNGEGYDIKFKYQENMELANPQDEDGKDVVPPKAGDEGMISLNLMAKDDFQREMAQGIFKEVMKALATKFGSKSPRELLAEGEGASAVIVTSLRANKDKTANFLVLQKIEFV